jgi:hypothetical protein
MKAAGMTITKYLVDQVANCVSFLIDQGDTAKARDIYLRIIAMFRFLVRIGYRFNELDLYCRLDVFSIKRIFSGRGVEL